MNTGWHGYSSIARRLGVTKEQANEIAAFIQERLAKEKIWSISVSETRKVDPDSPTKYRVLIHGMDGSQPLAIYSARILTRKPQEAII